MSTTVTPKPGSQLWGKQMKRSLNGKETVNLRTAIQFHGSKRRTKKEALGVIGSGWRRSASRRGLKSIAIVLKSPTTTLGDRGGWQGNGGKGMILRGGNRSGPISPHSLASIPLLNPSFSSVRTNCSYQIETFPMLSAPANGRPVPASIT